jgi:hypothetical protein
VDYPQTTLLLNREVMCESHRCISSFGAVGDDQDNPEDVNTPN